MEQSVEQKSQTKRRSVPITFLNSTLALFMVVAGFVVQDLLSARGFISLSVLISISLIAFNFMVIHFWRQLDTAGWSERPLFFLIGSQWCWVFYVVVGFYVPEVIPSFLVAALVVWVGVWRLFQSKQNKWVGTVLFSVFGSLAMGFSIWHGLEDWTLSASARLKDGLPSSSRDRKTQASFKQKIVGQVVQARSADVGKDWSYSGETGPAMWGVIRDDFKRCAEGVGQSPVDVPRHANLIRDWGSAKWSAETGEIVKEGESFRVDLAGESIFLIRSRIYRSKQLFVHTPSEHQVSGLKYPMEFQLVLESQTGELMALAAFVEIGNENSEFQKIVSTMRSEPKHKHSVSDLKISSFFPEDLAAYRYKGSITMPPCVEGVLWSVLKKPIELSGAQVAAFRKLFPSNARPLQPLGQRTFEIEPAKLAH